MHEEVVIRHAASNQLQRNAPHCKPPAAPKRPPDRSQTAPAPAGAYPALRLGITDEASPLALRSTRNRPRRAVRRGAASPATEQLPSSPKGSPALAGGLTAEPAWATERRSRRPQEHDWDPRARSLGVVARSSGCRPSLRPRQPCPRPRPASGGQCPLSASKRACPRDRVQCPVRASERPGVQCPASGVCSFPRPLCPTEVSSWGGGQAAARLGWPGSAWLPAVPMTGSSSAQVGAWRSSLAQAVLGQRRHRLGPGRRPERWLASGLVDLRGRPG
jgi:hypothetical protein